MEEPRKPVSQLTAEELLFCCHCGCIIWLPDCVRETRTSNHKPVFCPNGHENAFSEKTEADELRSQLADVINKRDRSISEVLNKADSYARALERAKKETAKIKAELAKWKGTAPTTKKAKAAK